jgi:glycosyltransferase involved in cell wall biosynthesis
MYWSLPIVASSVNGVKEVILHEQTGLLVPPNDPQALAAAIDRLASVRELAQRLGVNAHAKATELMDGQQMIVAIERLYDELSRRLIWPQLTSSSIPPAVSETSSQI